MRSWVQIPPSRLVKAAFGRPFLFAGRGAGGSARCISVTVDRPAAVGRVFLRSIRDDEVVGSKPAVPTSEGRLGRPFMDAWVWGLLVGCRDCEEGVGPALMLEVRVDRDLNQRRGGAVDNNVGCFTADELL